MNDKLKSMLNALQPGETVQNPVAVTQYANAVMLLIGLITAVLTLLHVFGVDYKLDSDQIATVAGCLVTIVTLVRTLISKITNEAPALPAVLKPKPPDDPVQPLDAVVDLDDQRKKKFERDSLLP